MPKVTKEALVGTIARETPYSRETVDKIVKSLFGEIAFQLSQGREVQIAGFGTFELKKRAPRTGRNPHKNEPVYIPARIVPSFKPSPQLKEVTVKDIGKVKE